MLRGDLRRLAGRGFTALQKKGLADRIRGALAGLDLLFRLADQEAGRPPRVGLYRARIAGLRHAFEMGALAHDDDTLAGMIRDFPFRATGLRPASGRLMQARTLHEELCAGCHDAPDLEVERPAYDLFNEAKRLSQMEFAARLVTGVRGDRVTGIDNPLTDAQIAGLIALYRTGN
ncbi:MAG: hypothetical protein ACR2PO_00725 [Methyloligellaceae bacterium]